MQFPTNGIDFRLKCLSYEKPLTLTLTCLLLLSGSEVAKQFIFVNKRETMVDQTSLIPPVQSCANTGCISITIHARCVFFKGSSSIYPT